MKYSYMEFVEYKGVKINNVNYEHVHKMITKVLADNQKGYICLNDVANIYFATRNVQQRNAINDSLLSLPDGMPLVWYAWMVGCKEIERISGASLLQRLLVDMHHCKHFLLGDTELTINKVIAEAKKLNGNLVINGHSPPFKVFNDEDNQRMIDKIREADADIVWVCFGGQKQEKWMSQNISRLDKGVMIGVGAAFRFFIGDITTPPQIFQKMGMQWVFRLTEDFLKDPGHTVKAIREKELLKSKVYFMVNLPLEVSKSRKKFKQRIRSDNGADD